MRSTHRVLHESFIFCTLGIVPKQSMHFSSKCWRLAEYLKNLNISQIQASVLLNARILQADTIARFNLCTAQ